MANKFVSFLEKVGKDVEKGLFYVLKPAAVAASIIDPAAAPLINMVYQAVLTAEQNFAGITGSGPQKLAAVTSIVGNLIQQTLSAAGKSATAQDVQNVINGVVSVLSTIPAPPAS